MSFENQFQEEKLAICEVGKRLYAKGFSSANDGNITMRVGDDHFLCTRPTKLQTPRNSPKRSSRLLPIQTQLS